MRPNNILLRASCVIAEDAQANLGFRSRLYMRLLWKSNEFFPVFVRIAARGDAFEEFSI